MKKIVTIKRKTKKQDGVKILLDNSNTMYRFNNKEHEKMAIRTFVSYMRDALNDPESLLKYALEIQKYEDSQGYDKFYVITLAVGGPAIYLTIGEKHVMFEYYWWGEKLIVDMRGYYIGDLLKEKLLPLLDF